MPEPNPFDLQLSEQLRTALSLTGDPKDRILVEVAAETDNLQEIINKQDPPLKPTVKAQASTRRVNALRHLWDILNDREEKLQSKTLVTLMANMMRELRTVMQECELPRETMEVVMQGLMARLEEAGKGQRSTSSNVPQQRTLPSEPS